MLNPSDNNPEQQPHRLQALQWLLQNYPIPFWGGVWAIFVTVATVAAIGMFNPGPIEQETSKPTPTRTTIQDYTVREVPKSTPTPTPDQELASKKASDPQTAITTIRESTAREGLPLSFFGSLALGCAAGSLVVARRLKQSSQRRPSLKRTKSATPVRRKRRRSSKKRHLVPRPPQPVNSQPTVKISEEPPSIPDNKQAQVTVLPAEENHPLDGREETLAEILDLRKRESLASLMRRR
ncbi:MULTISPECIES: hypothetical protein [unclassified Coleofasciculus]|uniref:hypothetical protein n=1 Tax=unclassified Coleofasciculus TaxID=2692782 RepID=UPI00187E7533|nr:MULTISPECIES: hypothetical protein [unclassified Coleofasciculus]MBE9124885.1 hypothetical protein [Coleofasciculus sp. LEGE 07081]MBE9147871.1 hypothetical protein [Coleofasciculus sp. LEGE 07092]